MKSEQTEEDESPDIPMQLPLDIDIENDQIFKELCQTINENNECNVCGQKFSLFRKKKNCSFCGNCVCDQHSKRKRADPKNNSIFVKICDLCHLKYLNQMIFHEFSVSKNKNDQIIAQKNQELKDRDIQLKQLKNLFYVKQKEIQKSSVDFEKVQRNLDTIQIQVNQYQEKIDQTEASNAMALKKIVEITNQDSYLKKQVEEYEQQKESVQFQLQGLEEDIKVLDQMRLKIELQKQQALDQQSKGKQNKKTKQINGNKQQESILQLQQQQQQIIEAQTKKQKLTQKNKKDEKIKENIDVQETKKRKSQKHEKIKEEKIIEEIIKKEKIEDKVEVKENIQIKNKKKSKILQREEDQIAMSLDVMMTENKQKNKQMSQETAGISTKDDTDAYTFDNKNSNGFKEKDEVINKMEEENNKNNNNQKNVFLDYTEFQNNEQTPGRKQSQNSSGTIEYQIFASQLGGITSQNKTIIYETSHYEDELTYNLLDTLKPIPEKNQPTSSHVQGCKCTIF